MQVSIDYFDPNNGQETDFAQRVIDLCANDETEITIPELNSTYMCNDPIQLTQLKSAIEEYYVTVRGEINYSDLVNSEQFTQRVKMVINVIGFILGAGSLFYSIICWNDDWVMGLTWILLAVGLFVQLWLIDNLISHLIETSKTVRYLYNRREK